jgi:hypothetical protein
MASPGRLAESPLSPPPFAGDRGAALFVWGIWAIMGLSVLAFIRTNGSNVPFDDEWWMVPVLTHHRPVTLKYLWSLHNEHRILLPRLLYLGLAKLTGTDFRAGMYFIAAALAGIAAAMIWAARRLRGWTSYADAFFPLALLHVGHCENLLWSFQVTFMSSTLLVCGLLFLILHSRRRLTRGTALAGGLCLIGLPLCGANGLPLVPLLAVWLTYWALRDRRTSGLAGIGNLALVLTLAGAALILVTLYFTDFGRRAPPSPSWLATTEVAGEFLASSLGFGALPWWPYIGYALGGVLVFCAAGLLICWWRQPPERVRCAGLLLFFVGLVGLALAIGWGRAGFGAPEAHLGFAFRYSMVAVPVLCGVFFLGEITGRAALARFLQMALFTCLGVLLVPNTQAGLWLAQFKIHNVKAVERDLRSAYTSKQLAQKHLLACRDHDFMEACLEMLRKAGVGKYKRLRPPPPSEGLGPVGAGSGAPNPQTGKDPAQSAG